MDKKRSIYGLCALVVLVAPFTTSAACISFDRSLKIGMSGEDIRSLQRVLNGGAETKIAISGPGSPGNETVFFGPATDAAVKKFQLMHAASVLTPAGLTTATGFVGKFTRDALTQLSCSGTVSTTFDSPAVTAAKQAADIAQNKQKVETALSNMTQLLTNTSVVSTLAARAAERAVTSALNPSGAPTSTILPITGTAGKYPLQLFSLSPMLVMRGAKISFTGTGFSPNTRLHIGSNVYTLNGGALADTASFMIPLDYPLGSYVVTLEDAGTLSNTRTLIVAADLDHQPTIDSLSPDSGNVGTTITIKGRNFAPKNDIPTSVGTLRDISSSDGTTIVFTLTAKSDLIKDGKLLPYLPFFLSVMNINGVSGYKTFNIR